MNNLQINIIKNAISVLTENNILNNNINNVEKMFEVIKSALDDDVISFILEKNLKRKDEISKLIISSSEAICKCMSKAKNSVKQSYENESPITLREKMFEEFNEVVESMLDNEGFERISSELDDLITSTVMFRKQLDKYLILKQK